jgi:hypothetical protein
MQKYRSGSRNQGAVFKDFSRTDVNPECGNNRKNGKKCGKMSGQKNAENVRTRRKEHACIISSHTQVNQKSGRIVEVHRQKRRTQLNLKGLPYPQRLE